jgi:hypothetical protein
MCGRRINFLAQSTPEKGRRVADESSNDMTQQGGTGASERKVHEPGRLRLPGFLIEEGKEVGLGDAVERVTYKMGIKHPCSGCERRAAALNRWMRFSR